MSTGGDYLTRPEKDRLLSFLKRRQLKDRVLELLRVAKATHEDRMGDISLAKNTTYEMLVEAVATCLSRGVISVESLTEEFDRVELAGRQHVLLFRLPSERVRATRRQLLSKVIDPSGRGIHEFIQVPVATTAHTLVDSTDELTVKFISRRIDWQEVVLEESEDVRLIRKERTIERASIIVKITPARNLLQVRVPPRSGFTDSETSRKVYSLATNVLTAAFGDAGPSLIHDLPTFPLGHAYSGLATTRDDFTMLSDSPEGAEFRAVFTRRGAGSTIDIRDMDDYSFHGGTFARTLMRGLWWLDDDTSVPCAMHWETVKIGSMQRDVARVYFPKLSSDAEIEYVIGRICEHAV